LQLKPQVLALQVGFALATLVEQTLPHVLQLLMSLVVSTHVPPQSVGVDVGQPEMHVLVPPSPAPQTGVDPLQATPHAPQLDVLFSCTHAPLHSVYPALHVIVQDLLTQAGWPLVTLGHTFPQDPQLVGLLVISTHEPLHRVGAVDGQPLTHEYELFEPAHTGVLPEQA
jgi:hypothetical protein